MNFEMLREMLDRSTSNERKKNSRSIVYSIFFCLIIISFIFFYSETRAETQATLNIGAPTSEGLLADIKTVALHGDLRDVDFVEGVFHTSFKFKELSLAADGDPRIAQTPNMINIPRRIVRQSTTHDSIFPDHPEIFRNMQVVYRYMKDGTYDFPYGGAIATIAELDFIDVEEYKCFNWQSLSFFFGSSPRMLSSDRVITGDEEQTIESLSGVYSFVLKTTPDYVTELIVRGPIRQPGCVWWLTVWQHLPY